MKDINEIIQSDLLERYVLGSVSDEEKKYVLQLKKDHNLIAEEIYRIEIALERMAVENQIPAPSTVKTNVSQIPTSSGSSSLQQVKYLWPKLAAALLLGGMITGIILSNSISKLNTQNEDLQQKLSVLQIECNQTTEQFAFLNDPNTRPILLEAINNDADQQVVVYWNESVKQSTIRVIELPELESGQTYQLWADVEGEMLDCGIFNSNIASNEFIRMGFRENATSLNITIEPEGGSDHPTVSKLILSELI